MTTEAVAVVPGPVSGVDRRWRLPVMVLGFVAAVAVASIALSGLGVFPESWNIGLAQPISDARRWLISNQTSHWLYTVVLNPPSDLVDWTIRRLEDVLGATPWFTFVGLAGIAMWWVRGAKAGVASMIAVVYFGLVELWSESLQTLALMTVAVLFAVTLGLPIGVAAGLNDRVQRIVRPILDAMQTMPGFVYLVPFTLLFSVGRVPALVSTVIFALPPVVRATDLGIRGVKEATVEASTMFGATPRQTLFDVRLPLARPSVLVGVNQTINLAMSMVVIAAFIGAGGLGQVVLNSLQRLRVGAAAEAGIAIVLMAILLDRFFAGLAEPTRHLNRRTLKYSLGGLVGLTLVGLVAGVGEFSERVTLHYSQPIDDLVDWAQVNLFDIGGSGIGTGPFSDFVTINLVSPLRELLSMNIPWLVLIVALAAVGLAIGNWRLGVFIAACLFGIGILGMWELSMDTLAQVLVALAGTLAAGIPIGIWTARSDRFRSFVRPVLDLLQTIPSFVLIVPVIMLFNVGRIPGIIASIIYAMPATIHYTDLGLRGVPDSTVEAATSYGATKRQRLFGIELPLAAPSILLAINQTIMLILAMVVIAGLVGGGGLGLETVRALRRTDSVGRGFEAGIAIVLLAAVLDRITRTMADRLQPPDAH